MNWKEKNLWKSWYKKVPQYEVKSISKKEANSMLHMKNANGEPDLFNRNAHREWDRERFLKVFGEVFSRPEFEDQN